MGEQFFQEAIMGLVHFGQSELPVRIYMGTGFYFFFKSARIAKGKICPFSSPFTINKARVVMDRIWPSWIKSRSHGAGLGYPGLGLRQDNVAPMWYKPGFWFPRKARGNQRSKYLDCSELSIRMRCLAMLLVTGFPERGLYRIQQ